MSDSDDIRVQLARIEGKQDVTNERLDTANKINDERYGAVKGHLATIDGRLNSHSDRLGILENRNHLSDGERKGIALSARVIWALGGGGIIGALALIARAMGL